MIDWANCGFSSSTSPPIVPHAQRWNGNRLNKLFVAWRNDLLVHPVGRQIIDRHLGLALVTGHIGAKAISFFDGALLVS